jgi:hypothetical protein
LLERAGAPCLVWGGWAEELLGLRAEGPHRDIDLVCLSNAFASIDMGFERRRLPAEIRSKRFPHKRAFRWRGLCCKILLIQDWRARPVTWFWGDVPLFWQAPIAHPSDVIRAGHRLNAVSAANLRLYRARHRDIQPWRWRTCSGDCYAAAFRRAKPASRSAIRSSGSSSPA